MIEGSRILLLQQRQWGQAIGHALARRLHAEGASLAAITFKPETDTFVRSQTEVPYRHVLSHDTVMGDPSSVEGAERVSLAEVCEALGVPSIWPYVGTLRNHVRNYGDKYYYAFRQARSDDEIIAYVKAVYVVLHTLVERFDPDVALAPNFVAFPQIVLGRLLERRGRRMITVTDTKVRGVYTFTYSLTSDDGPFINRIDELNAGASSPSADRATRYVAEGRTWPPAPVYAEKRAQRSFKAAVKDEVRPYVHIVRYLAARPTRSSHGQITLDNRPPRIILRDHYAHRRNARDLRRLPYVDLRSIGEFAYLPLQFQPEATIDVIAPYFNNQIEVARLVAQSLPGDLTLVVKEHPEMVGRRGRSYYEKLAYAPNVKLADPLVPGSELIESCSLVVSMSGTTLAESALLRRPAIQLGELGMTRRLPNVTYHTDMTTLSAAMQGALELDTDSPEYEQRLVNYVAAAYDAGFELDYMAAWLGDEKESDELWKIHREEIERALREKGS